MNTPYAQGQQAARAWLAVNNCETPEPTNPHEHRTQPGRMTNEARHWYAGYNAEMYRAFGDPDRDMERAERAFGC